MTQMIQDRLAALREVMRRESIDAFIFPSTDPHNGEYVPAHWEGRKWISGFDGSAGTAVVTMDKAAKHGILFKNAEALENAGRMEICVMDKTGTITQGVMHVTDITAVSQKEELLTYAVSLEKKSSHPVGQAVAQYGQENGVSVMDGTDVTVENGRGIHARMDGHLIRGGNLSWIGELKPNCFDNQYRPVL